MKRPYVIFRTGRLPGRGYNEELFIDGNGSMSNDRSKAATFNNARSAYVWAHTRHLDEWQVGQR